MNGYATYIDNNNKFVEFFNSNTGMYYRSGIIQDKKDTGVDPFMRNFPSLLDIGIMGHCIHGKSGLCAKSGVQCYQSGLTKQEPNMTLENYKKIIDESKGRVWQIAEGGRGDPDQHENFEQILDYTRINGIVPNFTSSGLGFNDKIVSLCKQFCGSVAISDYKNEYTYNAVKMLLKADVKTNMHYVLGNNSIDEAIYRLKNNGFPEGINAVIFLLHKPVGQGQVNNVLQYDDPRVKEFFEIIDTQDLPFKVGFDSCTIPGILNFTSRIDRNSIDSCEAARFSAYITSDMKMLPCSFDNQSMRWAYDISNDSIISAWYSEQFEDFRKHLKGSCPDCAQRTECLGGCPICPNIVLCNSCKRCRG